MNKQEFLAASLPYGIKIKDSFSPIRLTGIMGNEYHFGSSLSIEGAENVAPIIRPLSDLTKECVQKDYNNGEPFIPIEMLRVEIGSGWCDAFEQAIEALCEDNSKVLMMPYPFIKLFLKWHFNLMEESVEVIEVTDEFNPYK